MGRAVGFGDGQAWVDGDVGFRSESVADPPDAQFSNFSNSVHCHHGGGGLIHDYTHGYNALIVFALVNVILGMIPFLVVPALRR